MGRECVLRAGDSLDLGDTDVQSAEFLRNCLTEPGARLRLTLPSEAEPMLPLFPIAVASAQEPEPEHAPAAHEAPHRAASHHATPVAHEAPELPEPPAPPAPPELPASPVAPELHASTEAPAPDANGVPDLSQIQGLAGGNPVVTVILALILVGGGTAGWKFWNQKSKQNHELRLQELELQKEMAGLQGAQPPPCQAANVKLQADIAALQESKAKHEELHRRLDDSLRSLADRLSDAEARLGKIEKKATSLLSGDFDPDEIIERLEKAEKELKAVKTAAKAAATKK